MKQIIFHSVLNARDGGYSARASNGGNPILTDGNSWEELLDNIKEVVASHCSYHNEEYHSRIYLNYNSSKKNPPDQSSQVVLLL